MRFWECSVHGGSCRALGLQLPLWIELACTHSVCFSGAILSYQRFFWCFGFSMAESFSKKPKLMPPCAQRIRYSIQLEVGRYILQVAGWNLIITRKPLALKIINNLYIRQGFLHKIVRLFHIVKTRSIRYKYLSIDTLRPVKSLQSHLDGRSTDVSIDSRFRLWSSSTMEDTDIHIAT